MTARQFAIILSIAILYPALVFYGVGTFQPLPAFKQSGYVVIVRKAPSTPAEWKAEEEEYRALVKKRQEERDAQDKATQPFYRALIRIATPLAIAMIFVGSYLKFHSVGAGLVFGAVVSVTNAYWNYWAHLDDWIRYLSLLLGPCLLVFIGYRQFVIARNNPT